MRLLALSRAPLQISRTGLNVITELVAGFLLPGRPIGNVVFKVRSLSALPRAVDDEIAQCWGYMSEPCHPSYPSRSGLTGSLPCHKRSGSLATSSLRCTARCVFSASIDGTFMSSDKCSDSPTTYVHRAVRLTASLSRHQMSHVAQELGYGGWLARQLRHAKAGALGVIRCHCPLTMSYAQVIAAKRPYLDGTLVDPTGQWDGRAPGIFYSASVIWVRLAPSCRVTALNVVPRVSSVQPGAPGSSRCDGAHADRTASSAVNIACCTLALSLAPYCQSYPGVRSFLHSMM